MNRSRAIAALSAFTFLGVLAGSPAVAEADSRGVSVRCEPGQTATVSAVGNAYQVRCISAGYAPVAYRGSSQRVVSNQRPRTVYVQRKQRSWKRSAAIIGGSTAAGAGVGKVVGGSAKKGAVVGGVGGVVYDLATRNKKQ